MQTPSHLSTQKCAKAIRRNLRPLGAHRLLHCDVICTWSALRKQKGHKPVHDTSWASWLCVMESALLSKTACALPSEATQNRWLCCKRNVIGTTWIPGKTVAQTIFGWGTVSLTFRCGRSFLLSLFAEINACVFFVTADMAEDWPAKDF